MGLEGSLMFETLGLLIIAAIGLAASVRAFIWATRPLKRNTLLDQHYSELEERK